MLSVLLPEAPFEHRSVSFRTSLMRRPAGIRGRALPVVLATMRKRGTVANSREAESIIPRSVRLSG
jgi:hypothetical protein